MTLSVDDFLTKIGGMGRFQWMLVCVVGIMMVPVTFQPLIMAFLGLEPPWRCIQNSTVCNFTHEFDMSSNDPNKNFRCDIKDSEWEFTKPYTSIVTEWRLVCSRSALSWLTTSIQFSGWLFGNVVFGVLSDKYGRRKVLFFSCSMVCWVAFASSFVPWYWLYAVLRFLIGFGLGGAIVCLFIMATEFVDPNHRAMAGTFAWYFWTGALMMVALLAYLIRDWRKLSIATSAPGLVLFIFWIVVPESVRWLTTHQRVGEAENILKRVANTNKKPMPEENLGLPDDQKTTEKEAGFMDLFGSRSMTKKTIISWISWFVNAQVYFGVSLGSVMLGGNIYLNFFLTSLVELPGNAFAIYAMNRFGRKKVVVIGLIVAAISNLLVTVIPSDPNNTGYAAGRIIFAMIGKFSVMNSFDAIFVFSSELFPTVVRNIGLGSSSAAGRLGSITSPFVLSLRKHMVQLPYIIMAVDAFVAGLLCLLLPETNNTPTAETLKGAEASDAIDLGLLAAKGEDEEEDPEKMTVM
ncbi:organic cation transporter protein-like isoform X1 [Stylophora pistillata]|uniref:Organic cation transporter protein n=1 Tax=Stylophora pistillata TaxID=50429 RepID=A0A2B4SXU0_STYPI|nr:organic cation transporter protein-like isoform X1 [Stylophora pistillata]XP_022803522.1 organic cation transporter protein-like isoform X1 [Stylophora pistillata]PFX33205.1 Organic cation transporter protein [Stylophora pistillata]